VCIVRACLFLVGVIRSGPMWQVLGVVTIIMLGSSTAIYLLEYGVNENIKSFPDALWWSIVTTTTVGYGDISPVTSGGRIMATILMVTGIGMIGALTANFATHWTQTHDAKSDSETDRLTEEIRKQTISHIQQIESLREEEYETLKESLDLLYRRTRKKHEEE
ncbi:two pore domain potassium channel family protein, partial [Mesorhizobium sp. M00.F.Ca.ET.186.01.1.1]